MRCVLAYQFKLIRLSQDSHDDMATDDRCSLFSVIVLGVLEASDVPTTNIEQEDPPVDQPSNSEASTGVEKESSEAASSGKEPNPIEDDLATPFDSDQMEKSQSQPEINMESLVDYELVRDRAKRIIKPNIGSVMYAMISTRPDLAQAISVLSRLLCKLEKPVTACYGPSTTEVEYIAVTEAIKEAIWLQGLLGVEASRSSTTLLPLA
ncbi:hypothetical protein EZV62_008340 [Acer yangbiense]|uniref:Reverse transcriptase Ty1/copia-type domain-containing protein n=1 Tax=Acer yangbiense TaxID=1000413 RepID=A0A5C7IDF1_9ROSI|nr:hypothetical protein EZV62_008340 [Acer yangbiense]